MKRPKVDTSGTEKATAAVAEAQTAANNLRQNMAADLTNENIATVVAGGAAGEGSGFAGPTKRRRTGVGLSSQLGIS
jgi:hypothetical protein